MAYTVWYFFMYLLLDNYGETLCTLNFASRVASIELGAVSKSVTSGELLKAFKIAEESETKLSKTISELESTKIKVAELTKELKTHSTVRSEQTPLEKQSMNHNSVALQGTVNTHKREISVLNKQLSKAKDEIEKLKKSLNVSKLSEKEISQKMSTMHKQIETVKREKAVAYEKAAKTRVEAEKLEVNLKEIKEKKKMIQRKNNRLSLQNSSLSTNLETLRKEVNNNTLIS